ncbi:MAG: hypothetical protein H0X03_08990 [Nitrosopumilus sp.]|nr:hypothetical protein [Nitrosopumilus sp.]
MNEYKINLLGLPLLLVNLLLLAALAHLIMKVLNNNNGLTEDYLSTGVYNQCIISEPNEIASMKIQDNLEDSGKQKVTFYNFNEIPYPATLNVDFLEGVMVNAKLNNNKDAFLNIDYGNHTCELTIYDNTSTDFKKIYDKKGYLGSSTDNKDIDDFFYRLHKEHNTNVKKH